MIWKYKNRLYESKPVDLCRKQEKSVLDPEDSDFYLVYHPKWDKCFWTSGPQISGNGNRWKLYLIDVYTNRYCYCEAKNLEVVIPYKKKKCVGVKNIVQI